MFEIMSMLMYVFCIFAVGIVVLLPILIPIMFALEVFEGTQNIRDYKDKVR